MRQETVIENLIARFECWILKPLQEDVADQSRSHFILFILFSVAIDNLASIRYLGEIPDTVEGAVGKRYREFIRNYMPAKYKRFADVLYKGFRCKLVHEFQLEGFDIRQDLKSREQHLSEVLNKNICLNSEEFLKDLIFAFNKLKMDMLGTTAKKHILEAFEKTSYKHWVHTE
jgi:hypothetical protein